MFHYFSASLQINWKSAKKIMKKFSSWTLLFLFTVLIMNVLFWAQSNYLAAEEEKVGCIEPKLGLIKNNVQLANAIARCHQN